jgi:hypothetical protein
VPGKVTVLLLVPLVLLAIKESSRAERLRRSARPPLLFVSDR